MKTDNTKVMIERIQKGMYDDKLNIILSNSDRMHNYPVWKAANQRKQIVGKGANLKLPTADHIHPKMPDGVRCGLTDPALKQYAEELGAMLSAVIRAYPDLRLLCGYTFKHIRTEKHFGNDMVSTRIGPDDHYVEIFAGPGVEDEDLYMVRLNTPGFAAETHYIDDAKTARERLLEVVRDEHFD